MADKVNLTVRLTPQVDRELGIAAGMCGTSKTDFIRSAIDAALRTVPGALTVIAADMRTRLDAHERVSA